MIVKSRPVYRGTFRDIMNRDVLRCLLGKELVKSLVQQLRVLLIRGSIATEAAFIGDYSKIRIGGLSIKRRIYDICRFH